MDKILETFREIGNEAHKVISTEKRGKKIIGMNPLGQKSLVMDHMIEDIAIEILKKSSIGKILVTEEKGEVALSSGADGVVVLDPLDGSTNYERGIPIYCIGISYSKTRSSDDITHSYVMDLARGDEFWAVAGKGAFLNGNKISPSKETELSKCIIASDRVPQNINELFSLYTKIYDVRRTGPDILDICYVANGGYDGFVKITGKLSAIHICGVKIAEESGAIVTDMFGTKINTELCVTNYLNIVCSGNKNIHEQLIKLLKVKKC